MDDGRWEEFPLGGASPVNPAQRLKLYVMLAPAPRGAADPVKSVESVPGDPRAARIAFAGGRVYEVRFTDGSAEARLVQAAIE